MKNTILNKFNEALKPVTSIAESISETLNNQANLKLHEVVYLDEYNEGDFDFFCREQITLWEDFLNEHNLKVEHIGRTSSFYLNSKYYDMFEYEYNGKINARNLTKLICQNSGIDLDYIKVNDNGVISELEDVKFADGSCSSWEDYFLDEHDLDSYVRDLVDEVEKFLEELKEIEAGYKYLEEFKENQVSIYKEFFGLNN